MEPPHTPLWRVTAARTYLETRNAAAQSWLEESVRGAERALAQVASEKGQAAGGSVS